VIPNGNVCDDVDAVSFPDTIFVALGEMDMGNATATDRVKVA
jgi:hypothetical protein